jgi:hypothetical protein
LMQQHEEMQDLTFVFVASPEPASVANAAFLISAYLVSNDPFSPILCYS